MNPITDPEKREEVLIGMAAIALHGLLSGGLPPGATFEQVVVNAFSMAREFIKAAEAIKP